MERYNPAYPGGLSTQPDLDSFLKAFFTISDTPGLDHEYVEMFTQDAVFTLASKVSNGSDGMY